MDVGPVIVIPTYWADVRAEQQAPGAYDHSTDLNREDTELDRCLASLENVDDVAPIVLLVVCPLSATSDVSMRVQRIAQDHPSLAITTADFMKRAVYALGHETRQGLPILAKSGYFFNEENSPFANTSKVGITNRWWTKRVEFNQWMRRALGGTRISRSNYVCGGCFAVHARAYMRVAFDPFITRGEDLDYLFNLRLHGLDVWFDNRWSVRHLPPAVEQRAPRFMQDVYRWYYERVKLADANRQNDLNSVTPASLMPYPGPWISSELDSRVRKTAIVRTFFTREHRAYWGIWRHGRSNALRYARENTGKYLRFQSFWPAIMEGLWRDAQLAELFKEA